MLHVRVFFISGVKIIYGLLYNIKQMNANIVDVLADALAAVAEHGVLLE